jgi:hypothetical protein
MTQSIASLLRSSLNASSGQRLRRTSQLLSLEQRFMFDGAAVTDVAHAAQTPDAVATAAPAVPPAVVVREAEPVKDDGKKEVVLVDTSLADYKTLEAGVRDGVGIVEFDGSKDGLAQIAAWASTQSGLDAIHILSHGSEGVLNFGTSHLTEASLSDATTQAELASLGQALTNDGDLLLYGCDVAAGDSAVLLSGLAQATGADVAASTDLTGAARLGGNWTLEGHQGDIDTRELALAEYDGVLDTVSFTYGTDANDNNPVTSIVKNVGGQNIIFSSGEIYDYNDGLGIYPLAADHNSVTLTITIAAGYTFDVGSFLAQGILTTLGVTATFADGSVSGFTVNGIHIDGTLGLVNSFATPLNDIKSLVLTSTDYATFQDFVITDVKLAPPAAVAANAALSSDTGTSGSDFITNTASQTISGMLSANLAAGDKVEVSYNNGTSWADASTYMTGSKAWSTTTTLAGSGTFQVRVTNTTSGASSTAYTHTYTLDTTAPTTTFTGISLSADTGSSSTDMITKTASQTISAALSGAPAGTDVVYGSLDGGGSWTNITSKVFGTTLSWNGVTLGASSSSIMLKVADAAGNESPLSFANYTLDTGAPTTSVATATLSNDSGTSSTDFVTNMASQTVSGTLSANLAAGETVYVSLDNGGSWAAATATVGQSAWSLGRTLTASSTLKVKVSDAAGNDGAVLSQAYVYDTTAPSITFSGLTLSADTGASGSDFITKTAAQTIGATLSGALAGGDTLYGSLDNGSSWTNITSKVSGTTLSWNSVTLTGSDTLQLKVVDAAGNTGAVRSQAYVLDTTAPATPSTPDLATASDTGALNNDNITTDSTPTLSGAAENGSSVTLYDGATLLGTVTAGAGGWTYTTGVLSQGDHTIIAVSTDTAGNVSFASAGLTISVDTSAPSVASVAVPANGTYYSGNTLDFTVNFDEAVIVDTFGGTPRIALTVGATTRYADYVSGSGTSALLFRYTVQSGDVDADGVSIGALSLVGGSLQDAAGNDVALTLNSVGSTVGVNVDGSNPSITNVNASTADGSYGAGQTITLTVTFSSPVNVDTTNGTPTLALDGGGNATYTGGSGGTTLTFSYTVGAGQNSADLDYSSTSALALNGASIVDAGGAHQAAAVTLPTPGTAGSLGANKDLVIDTAAPTNTAAGAAFSADTGTSGSDFITKTAAQTVSGTLASNLAAGENVYVSLDNGSSWALAAASSGANTWSLAGQTLTGSGTLKVRITDDAGNNGAVYSQAYVLDTTAPTISFSDVALSADTGTSSTDLITNTAAQTISATLSGAPAAGDVVYGSLDNGASWTDITSKVSGTTLIWNGVTLAASDTLKLRVTDAAGNNGAATSAAYVLDTSGPSTSVATGGFSNDSGASSSDFITHTAAQTISGTLSANLAAGEVVYVSLDNGATWSLASASVGSNTWSLSGQTLTGSGTLKVRISDDAGNNGAVYAQAYVLDTTAPTISFSDVALSADTGTSSTDLITNTAAQTISATLSGAPAAGDVVYGSLDNGATWTDITSKVSGTTLTWNGVTLAASDTLRLRVTDAAGNNGAATSAAYVLDTSGPSTSVATGGFSNDSGASSSDFITHTAAQTISGTLSANLAAGEVVYVSLDNGITWSVASASVGSNAFELHNQTLTASDTLQIKISDVAGNDGPVLSQAYVYDTAATMPGVDSLTTPSLTPVLTGSATLAAGETMTVSVGGAVYNVTPVAGAWSLDLASAVPVSGALSLTLNQQHDVTATVTDLAGNVANDNTGGELIVGSLTPPTTPAAPFQTPPVVPEPLPPIPLPVSFLPSNVGEESAPPPSFNFGSESTWQSPTLSSQALQTDAVLRGGLIELLSPGAGPTLVGGRDVLAARTPIDDLAVHSGERITLQLNAETFMHNMPGQNVRMTAELADGRPLPSWLKFNARDGRFEGKVPADFSGKLTVRVIARDGLGHEAVQEFDIVIARDNQAQTSAPADSRLSTALADAVGRNSLTQQLRDARNQGISRLAELAASAGSHRT